MKAIAAICPLCEVQLLLGADAEVNQRIVNNHLATHTVEEWVQCVQGLREELHADFNLRVMPRCAMPRA